MICRFAPIVSSGVPGWRVHRLVAVIGLWLNSAVTIANADVELPKTGLQADEVAVVVNDDDPMSVRIAEYYQKRRGIPAGNILHVRFPSNGPTLSRALFKPIREAILAETGPKIQAYALAWTRPYRVDCMSITSAFAFGFDAAYCSAIPCGDTKPSAYFNTATHSPFQDAGIRPAMLLAGKSLSEVKRLIDRGIASDFTYPDHTGYLLNTKDRHRSVRAVFFDDAVKNLGEAFHLERLDADSIKNKTDVLFYFTGVKWVENLPSLRFVPGAIADHLTSTGGDLDGSRQMSSLRWLEAGATGSFGTVVEPCNHVQKFPIPSVAIWYYAQGNSLIEAYWKSVAWPGEGLFIGEPLARPFAPSLVDVKPDGATLKLFSPESKQAVLQASESPIGPFHDVANYPVKPGINSISIRLPETNKQYRILF